jgi:anti-sigma B factor antagonist
MVNIMQARETEDDGMHVVELEGEIDLARSPELRRVLEGHAKAQRPALALDFTGVSFIDSSGLATIVEYCKKAHDFGGKFAIFGLSDRVRTVFEIVRLNELFGVHDTREQARAAMLQPGSSPV